MRIEKTTLISGKPAKEVRDAFRKLSDWGESSEAIARAFNVDPSAAEVLVQGLLKDGFLEIAESKASGPRYRTSPQGMRLTNANFKKRITRNQAELLVRGFLERVRDVNRRDDLTHFVTEVRIFGSYLENVPDLGDIDLAVELGRRIAAGEDWIERLLARADSSGRTFKSYFERLTYGEREVRAILKAKSPYLSVHQFAIFDHIACRFEYCSSSTIRYPKGRQVRCPQ